MKEAGIHIKNKFSVASRTERGVTHFVDMEIGQCTCPQGKDGFPCSHQAVIAQ